MNNTEHLFKPDPKKEVKDVVYKLTLSRTDQPAQFHNLWSLTATMPNGTEEEVVVSNDSLQICIDKIGYMLEQDGF